MTALLGTIGLASPASLTYAETRPTPAATHFHQKQKKMASDLANSQKPWQK
jgi:hypothetical protein